MKSIVVSLVVMLGTLGTYEVVANSTQTQAQAQDDQCSMRRADGTIVDLGKLCGQSTTPAPTPTKPPVKPPVKPPIKEVVSDSCSTSQIAKYIASFATKDDMTAFEALVKCKAKAVPALIDASTKFIKKQDFSIIPSSIALQKIGKDSVSGLMGKLKNPDPKIRAWAIGILLDIKDAKEAMPSLIAALKDPDKNVRMTAALGFEIGKNELGRDVKNALPNLIALLKDDDYNIRFITARALGRIGANARDAIPALTIALNDPDVTMRSTAAAALKKIR